MNPVPSMTSALTPAERCPSCYEDECLQPILIDGDVYHVCCACDYSVGIDDSMSHEMLAAMIVADCLDLDGKQPEDVLEVGPPRDQLVKVKIVVCSTCGNDEICLLRIIGFDEKTEKLSLECMICAHKMAAPIGRYSNNNDDETRGKETESATEQLSCIERRISEPDIDLLTELTPVVCCDRCGNDNVDLFGIDVDTATGFLKKVVCFVCDCVSVLNEDNSNRSIHACRRAPDDVTTTGSRGLRQAEASKKLVNGDIPDIHGGLHFSAKRPGVDGDAARWDEDDDDVFERRNTGSDSPLRQQRKTPANVAVERRERVRSLSRLGRGDHIAWHKWYAVWHHAIVVEVDCRHAQVTVIHNSGGTSKSVDGKFASVRLETIGVDPVREDLYRHVYAADDERSCFRPEVVINRATSMLGQTYNPFTFNCEHFARWCKTGHQVSSQVKTFLNRLSTAGRSAVAGYGKEALASVMKSSASVNGALNSVIRRRPPTSGIIVSITTESATFAREANDAYRKYCVGEISRADFRQQVAQTGCECVGGLVTSAVFGAIGQVLIPVPAIGGFVGSSLGNLVGRWCGAMVGRQIKT